jgi:hypothetical protein
MRTTLRAYLCICIILCSWSAHSQKLSKSAIDSITNEVKQLLGNDWFLTPTKSGFTVYFCRSCHEEYIDSCNSAAAQNSAFAQRGFVVSRERESFFTPNHADSVSYYGTCCRLVQEHGANDSLKHLEKLKEYKANGIISFEITFDRKWSKKKYNSTQEKNEILRKEILKEPVYKTDLRIFSDYRFWLPREYWKERTTEYSFFFERLPYSSETLNCSIFIKPDKPYWASRPLYVDKSDPRYYDDEANGLEPERQRTLKLIAMALGIRDFVIIT